MYPPEDHQAASERRCGAEPFEPEQQDKYNRRPLTENRYTLVASKNKSKDGAREHCSSSSDGRPSEPVRRKSRVKRNEHQAQSIIYLGDATKSVVVITRGMQLRVVGIPCSVTPFPRHGRYQAKFQPCCANHDYQMRQWPCPV